MRTMHNNILALVAVCALFFTYPASAQSAATAKLFASSGVMQILLDNSGSSPATSEDVVMRAWAAVIEPKLRAMPPGSVILVNTVGTAELPPMSLRLRLLHRRSAEGGPMEDVVQTIREAVLGFPAKVKAGKVPEHGTSNLIGGLFDASHAINPAADNNVIIFISDLIENSSMGSCYATFPCRLPNPQFALPGTELIVLGVGWGMPADREISLVQVWHKWFSKVGLPKPAVLKTKIFG